MTTQKLAYTFDEAAEQIGYSVQTIRQQVVEGKLLARYANGKGVIRHEDLAEWLGSLPTEPPGGHAPSSYYTSDEPVRGGHETSTEAELCRPRPLFRTPEEIAPELGMSKTALRRYCRASGIHTKLGKNKIMLHENDVTRLVEWIRAQNEKASEWWNEEEAETDPFA